jgi:uncharacterized protein YrzB (UPF0473 family)
MPGGEEWMDEERVILTDEDGKEHAFEVVDVIEVDGSEYAILTPEDEEEEEPGEAMIFRIEHDEKGDEMLVEIEDDDEWERVAEAYDRLVEEEEDEDEDLEEDELEDDEEDYLDEEEEEGEEDEDDEDRPRR